MSGITRLLDAAQQGDPRAADELLPLVYQELRRLAAAKMAQQAPGHTLQATALVHEAWLRLTGGVRDEWQDRAHFFRAAAGMSRQDLKAVAAAVAARSMSTALPRATDASTMPSTGDFVSNVWPEADGTILPSIMCPMPSLFNLASRGAARSRLA